MGAISITLTLLLAVVGLQGSDWTRFRGPNGSGVSETGAMETEFGPGTNVVWKAPLPMGKSSPVIGGNRVFVTGHSGDRLLTLAFDRATGRELWRRTAPSHRLEPMHRLNDEASPTPVTDGRNVYVFFAGFGVLAYGPDGDELWSLPLGPFTNFHGMGASPILVGDQLVLVCDQDLDAYLIALDPANGEILWKRSRPDFVHSFSTPVVYDGGPSGPEIVVPGSYRMTGYSPGGVELWRLNGLTYQVKSSPVIGGDRLFFNGWAPGGEPAVRLELPPFGEMQQRFDKDGDHELTRQEVPEDWLPGNWEMHDRNKNGTLNARDWAHYRARRVSENACLSIRLGGRGDVTETHLGWRHRKSLPDVASPILYRGVLYLIRNGGIVTALDPESGAVLKQGRLRDAIDGYYASPVAADGKVFMASDQGKVAVLRAGPDWEILRTNDVGEEIFATPAIADGCLYLRTATRLYRFGRPASTGSPGSVPRASMRTGPPTGDL